MKVEMSFLDLRIDYDINVSSHQVYIVRYFDVNTYSHIGALAEVFKVALF